MAANDRQSRWWLLPGEVAARVGGAELVFDYDNGTLWGFTLRGIDGAPKVLWDHHAEAMVVAPKDEYLALREPVRAAIQAMSAPRPAWSLTRDERALLDAVAQSLRDDEWITGRRLRAVLKKDRADFDRLKDRLQPRYLRETTGDHGDYYSLTLPGLLVSSEASLVSKILDAVVSTLRSKFEVDPDVRSFTLDEVLHDAGLGDEQRALVINIVSIANLLWGGSGVGTGRESKRTWGIPQDIEVLATCKSHQEFLAVSRRSDAKHARCWPTAPVRGDFLPEQPVVVPAVEVAASKTAAPRPAPVASPAPKEVPVSAPGTSVDVGIMTIREDEFRAVLAAFPEGSDVLELRRHYNIRSTDAGGGRRYRVAIMRQLEQGNGEAQDAARDMIEDLHPRLLLVVGIAGGLPHDDFTLGDVVVSTRVNDYSVEARKEGEVPTYSLSGGPVFRAIGAAVANLPAREKDLGAWASSLPPRPPVAWAGKLYGPEAWQKEVHESLSHNFAKERVPVVTAGVIASSDRLIRDPEILFPWIQTARHLLAVEMESGGVYRAARDRVSMLAIRGISDIVGLKRDREWTSFACKSAATFAQAFLRTTPLPPVTAGSSTPPPSPLPTQAASSSVAPSTAPTIPTARGFRDLSQTVVFFHDRMCDAFPGLDGLHRCSSVEEAITRLEKLLTPPLRNGNISPVWTLSGTGSLAVESFEKVDSSTIRLGVDRYCVETVYGFRSRSYKYEFALVVHSGEMPSGVYPASTEEEMKELHDDFGDVTEEYGVIEDGKLFTRKEHDDGAAYRDGKLLDLDTRLEVRHLSRWLFLLVGQLSPIHQKSFDLERKVWVKNLVAGTKTVNDFVDRILGLPLHPRDE